MTSWKCVIKILLAYIKHKNNIKDKELKCRGQKDFSYSLNNSGHFIFLFGWVTSWQYEHLLDLLSSHSCPCQSLLEQSVCANTHVGRVKVGASQTWKTSSSSKMSSPLAEKLVGRTTTFCTVPWSGKDEKKWDCVTEREWEKEKSKWNFINYKEKQPK